MDEYTWKATEDEHGNIDLTMVTPLFLDPVGKRDWHVQVVYARYQLSVIRTTCRLGSKSTYPRVVDSVTLTDRSKDSLMQPKDWGHRRQESWKRGGTTLGLIADYCLLDWADIRGLKEFFPALHAMVAGCHHVGEWSPLADWIPEHSPLLEPLFSRPGDLE
jgi:hypothetical protein